MHVNTTFAVALYSLPILPLEYVLLKMFLLHSCGALVPRASFTRPFDNISERARGPIKVGGEAELCT